MIDGALIHVVDDDEGMRTALVRVLEAAGFEVRGYASTGEFLLNPPPDRLGCVLLDICLPGPSGLDLQDAIRRGGHAWPVVFLTGQPDVASSVRALKGGAVDYLTKPVHHEVLVEAVTRAVACDALHRAARDEADALRARFASLTDRERAVFEGVVAGRLNKQIADTLSMSERTVKLVRSHVLAKLGVGSAAELGQLSERLRAALSRQ